MRIPSKWVRLIIEYRRMINRHAFALILMHLCNLLLKTTINMERYIIEVLEKVSFDNALFRKELVKSKRWLNAEEWLIVKKWVLVNHADKLDAYTSVKLHSLDRMVV